MAKPHQRFFALIIALLFLATSVATGALVIWQIRRDSSQPEVAQTSPEDQAQSNCDISTPVPAATEPVPEAFKPEGDVTELQTTDLQEGTGEAASPGNCLVVKYHGTLASNGEKFDGNFDQETAIQFTLGAGNVIPGWDQGFTGMKPGGTRRLVIPSELAYRETGQGSIPPNADLVFVVKLIEIKQ